MIAILLVKEGTYLLTTLTWHWKIVVGEQNYGWLRAQSRSSAEVLACLSNWISTCLTLSACQLEIETPFDAEEL